MKGFGFGVLCLRFTVWGTCNMTIATFICFEPAALSAVFCSDLASESEAQALIREPQRQGVLR